MRRLIFFAGSVLVLASCSQTPTDPVTKIDVKPAKLECFNGMVIRTGANGELFCGWPD